MGKLFSGTSPLSNMLRSRIIPCLLIHKNGLVKSRKFGDYKYVGDPINAVRIFNEKQVDELMVLDIDASAQKQPPDFNLVRKIARECAMPLTYGGGVASVDDASRLIDLGVEKVAASAAAIDSPRLLSEIAARIGQQSVVVVLDVKKTLFGKYAIYTLNGQRKVKQSLEEMLSILEQIGYGEIVINNIDLDGEMSGYDLDLANMARQAVSGPLTFLGGAGDKKDLQSLIETVGVTGAGAGSMFVFNGTYKAVLISYLDKTERSSLYELRKQ
jgi:cyclase